MEGTITKFADDTRLEGGLLVCWKVSERPGQLGRTDRQGPDEILQGQMVNPVPEMAEPCSDAGCRQRSWRAAL